MRKAVRAIVIKDDSLLVMHRNKFGEQYYTLVGGSMNPGETAEQALYREVREETGLTVTNPRLVFVEDAGDMYGPQYIFVCDYHSGEVALTPGSEEYEINKLGQNLYTPGWLPLKDLPDVPFLSETLKQHMLQGIQNGWPAKPQTFQHIQV
jgi:8-oxo-dGTP diphosphatase